MAREIAIEEIAIETGPLRGQILQLLESSAFRPALERREERVSYEMHRLVVEKLADNPVPVLAKAAENLKGMRLRPHGSQAGGWVQEWERRIAGDLTELVEAMLRTDERSIDLRQMTPFAGVLSQEERLVAIRNAGKEPHAAQ